MNDHFNCIREMIQFVETKYPDYASQSVQRISNLDTKIINNTGMDLKKISFMKKIIHMQSKSLRLQSK